MPFDPARDLAADWRDGLWLGRIDRGEGPVPILISGGDAFDMSKAAPTVSQLIATGAFDTADGERIGPLDDLSASASLLSPIDLQCIKAAGVTFATSALERVIEEAARGNPDAAAAVRVRLEERIGGGLRQVEPGTPEAATLKAALIDEGLWSQYLEVAIGPDAEIFTKGPPLSSVGWGEAVGIRSDSGWNNPEPEIVLIVAPDGTIVGATLGNDVNLRDFEGRSALLLGKAKDNNASCAIGPLVRLFSPSYSLDDVRAAEITLRIEGPEGYELDGASTMREISRNPAELVRQALSEHQYPDGFVLFCGTLFAPTQDRGEPGRGFTHRVGDRVIISDTRIGRLVNDVATSRDAPPWTLGIGALMQNLARRGLLGA